LHRPQNVPFWLYPGRSHSTPNDGEEPTDPRIRTLEVAARERPRRTSGTVFSGSNFIRRGERSDVAIRKFREVNGDGTYGVTFPINELRLEGMVEDGELEDE
jgi:hypothetical protein